ncbi:MAG: hypothetical protein P1U68_03405 [Verrucomicrobiales bacterium]|nr:hypothetical protein [Verrucomicrobiales bacterium]
MIHPALQVIAIAFPKSEAAGLAYYAICALFFMFCGLACGYFIWRKGHMQTQDAEMEVKRTEAGLQALCLDLSEEEKGIRLESESAEIDKVVP